MRSQQRVTRKGFVSRKTERIASYTLNPRNRNKASLAHEFRCPRLSQNMTSTAHRSMLILALGQCTSHEARNEKRVLLPWTAEWANGFLRAVLQLWFESRRTTGMKTRQFFRRLLCTEGSERNILEQNLQRL